MTKVKTFHHSGRWDRPASRLAHSVQVTRKGGSIGTRTEMGSKAQDEVLKAWDNWAVYHPLTRYGYADCSIEWDLAEWQIVDRGLLTLSSLRIYTSKGHLKAPSLMPWVRLRHVDHGQLLNVGTAHMQLANTHTRRKGWKQEAASVRDWFADNQVSNVLYQADLNRDQRLQPMRWKVNRELVHGSGVHNLWAGHRPAHGGTHGPKLLDTALTNLAGRSYLLADDDSSDHRPFGSTLILPRQ